MCYQILKSVLVFVCKRWPEIARLMQNKKVFEVDTSKSSTQFQMVHIHAFILSHDYSCYSVDAQMRHFFF